MATKKSSKSTKKSTKKGAKKSIKGYGGKKPPIIPLYAAPIYQAIQRGDTNEMKALAKQARDHVASVNSALAALDKKIGS